MSSDTRGTAVVESSKKQCGDGLSVIVAGSRSITDLGDITTQRRIVTYAIDRAPFAVGEVVSGTARGVDKIGEEWASYHNIPVQRFPADWDKYGRSAGPRRNERMAAYADALIAIHVGDSPGTGHMIDTARSQLGNERVHVYKPSQE